MPTASRNAELLEKQIEKTPDDPRTTFYLGEAYRELFYVDEPAGNVEHARRAIALYRQRLDIGGGSAEEIYCSLYNIAVLVDEALGDWPEAMAGFIEAWEFRPQRVEPLYRLASGLRERGAYRTAYSFAREGRRIGPPADELFVIEWMYDFGIECEYAILAGLVGDYPTAVMASDRVLANPNFPDEYRANVEATRKKAVAAMKTSAGSSPDDERSAVVTISLEDVAGASNRWWLSWALPGEDHGPVTVAHVLGRAGEAIKEAIAKLPPASET